jgi:hypothetical protein
MLDQLGCRGRIPLAPIAGKNASLKQPPDTTKPKLAGGPVVPSELAKARASTSTLRSRRSRGVCTPGRLTAGSDLQAWAPRSQRRPVGFRPLDDLEQLAGSRRPKSNRAASPTSPARFAGSSYGQHSEGSLGATWPRLGRGALNELPLDLPLAGDAPRLSIPPASDDSLGPQLLLAAEPRQMRLCTSHEARPAFATDPFCGGGWQRK